VDASLFHRIENEVLARNDAFVDHVVNSGPKQIHVHADRLQVLAESRETPFEAVVVLLQILVLNKILTFFVDAVIRQLVENIRLRVLGGVLLACKPDQALLIYVDPQWLVRGHQNVDSQVKFVAVD